ncbi:hypothetical protein [Aeromonas salmonicida]|uniref:hypothetical protein n=1 Tax=Aeromonas salmonicida TaxID=645 RepID=UPI000F7668C0|nr:hypothetical protein [Aeromonas salmonicida]
MKNILTVALALGLIATGTQYILLEKRIEKLEHQTMIHQLILEHNAALGTTKLTPQLRTELFK